MVRLVLVVVLLDSPLHSLVVELLEFQQLVDSQQLVHSQQLLHSQQFGHLVQSQQVLQFPQHGQHMVQLGHLVQFQQVVQSTHPHVYLGNCSCYGQSDGICYIFFSVTSFAYLCVILSQLPLFQPFFSWVFLVRSSYVVDERQGREFFPIRLHD